MKLTTLQWRILGYIVDNWEPVELAYFAVARSLLDEEQDELLEPVQFRQDVFDLCISKYLTITQAPLKIKGQDFDRRPVEPTCPEEVFGDLEDKYRLFGLEHNDIQDASGYHMDSPQGIWIEITEAGKKEWLLEKDRREGSSSSSILN